MKDWKSAVKRHLPPGAWDVARLAVAELGLGNRHRRSVKQARKLTGAPWKINLGSGGILKEGWLNVDGFDTRADLQLDLRRRLPFPDGSISHVYSEHFFEHLEYPREVRLLLQQARRVLVPGGVFSVGVPDIKEVLHAYAAKHSLEWEGHPDWCSTPGHRVNYLFRQEGEHKYAYDFETLAAVLCEAGFSDPVQREWDPALDSAHRRQGTLYVDAVNPA